MKALLAALSLSVFAAGASPSERASTPGYQAEIEAWRGDRETRLKSTTGWLTLTGLFWLKPGANTVGSAAGSDVRLPADAVPDRVGVIELQDRQVTLRLEPGVAGAIKGRPVTTTVLRSDKEGEPDVLSLGRLVVTVIDRSGRLGIRVKDPESAVRRGFKGLQWFPVDEGWRVNARFVPHPAPRTVELADVTGAVQKMTAPGYVVFEHGGRELRLEPVLEQEGARELFFIFKDRTSGHETYGAGRYLYAALPRDGTVTIDFNKAYSPPCAFTRFATCPLPPRQNRLAVRVEAGEKHAGAHP
jgi:uncharacterized protein (DUF1684 family)